MPLPADARRRGTACVAGRGVRRRPRPASRGHRDLRRLLPHRVKAEPLAGAVRDLTGAEPGQDALLVALHVEDDVGRRAVAEKHLELRAGPLQVQHAEAAARYPRQRVGSVGKRQEVRVHRGDRRLVPAQNVAHADLAEAVERQPLNAPAGRPEEVVARVLDAANLFVLALVAPKNDGSLTSRQPHDGPLLQSKPEQPLGEDVSPPRAHPKTATGATRGQQIMRTRRQLRGRAIEKVNRDEGPASVAGG